MTFREETPRNPLQAKVNMKFCVATALSRRRVTHDDFTPAALADRDIMRLMDRIRVSISDDLPDNGEFPAEVRITLSNGSTRVGRRHVPRGGSTERLKMNRLCQAFDGSRGSWNVPARWRWMALNRAQVAGYCVRTLRQLATAPRRRCV
jgi:2-methylcitrate dehydratase PrpD